MSTIEIKEVEMIVIHCSATTPWQGVTEEDIRKWHKAKGWDDIGYHVYIRQSGLREYGRPFDVRGAHVAGHNHNSIGVCLEGGIDANGKAEDNFTFPQMRSLLETVDALHILFPNAVVCGHRDLSPDINGDGVIQRREWLKECPCFDVQTWLESVQRGRYYGKA